MPPLRAQQSRLDGEFAHLYPEVRRIAHQALRRGSLSWRSGSTLNTTALVHEAFLRLRSGNNISWQDDDHLMALIAQTMRYVLVDYARARTAARRGSGANTITLDEAMVMDQSVAEEVLAVDQALARLQEIQPRLARVVECRFLLGLTIDETARALGVSTMTIKRDWLSARALMSGFLSAAPVGQIRNIETET